MNNILIYGASGHAKVILDIIEKAGYFNVAGFIDDTESRADSFMGYTVFGNIAELCNKGVKAGLIAVGDNWQRSKIETSILKRYPDFEFVNAIHPAANIGKNVLIESGAVVMAGCSINSQVTIMRHCIINTGANVDHDCTIEKFASIAPGVTLGGNVAVGEYTAIGLGSSVIQKIDIGTHTVIGAGSVVVKNVPSHVVAYGNPCKTIRKRIDGEPYL